jgi:hypothetical protein
MEDTKATVLPDDVVREILLRVPAVEAAALFRCAVTCKQWHAIVVDPSFLRHHWPENACHPSSLLGFFDRYHIGNQRLPFFFPISPVLGPRRRPLDSFVSGAPPPGGIFNGAVPLAARGSLLLVRLATDRLACNSLCLAVCDILTGTCDVLPPLKCSFSRYGFAILTCEDCCSLDGRQERTPSTGYSTFFKVLAMVNGSDDWTYKFYTFLSSEPNWSEPIKCFDQVWQRDVFGLQIILGTTDRAVVCCGMAYWLGSYSTDQWSSPRYFTLGVNVKTGQISSAALSLPANQLAATSSIGLSLSVAVDGKLSLFELQKERLNTWTREDDGTWLSTRVMELKPPEHAYTSLESYICSDRCAVIQHGERAIHACMPPSF